MVDAPPSASEGKGASSTDNEKRSISNCVEAAPSPPSMTTALFVYWILPVLLLALFSRFSVTLSDPLSRPGGGRTVPLGDIAKEKQQLLQQRQKLLQQQQQQQQRQRASQNQGTPPSTSPSSPQPKRSSSYQDTLDQTNKRRRRAQTMRSPKPQENPAKVAQTTQTSTASSPQTHNAAAKDPKRLRLEEKIQKLRQDFRTKPNDVEAALALADTLREKDVLFHDGGTGQVEALDTYKHAASLVLKKRQEMVLRDEPTNVSLSGTANVKEEIMFEYSQKSMDGLLCAIFVNMGKQYFMANMFEKAVQSYSRCIDIEPLYLDAVSARGSSLIILGRYEEAGQDFSVVIENDTHRFFNDAFTGMSKVLAAKEDAVPEGWGPTVSTLNQLIPMLEERLLSVTSEHGKNVIRDNLNRLHHVMFSYHDVKTKDTEEAWKHLSEGYKHKMAALPPFNSQMEKHKLDTVTQIFHEGFWPTGIGSQSRVPIFIVGFVRSGSTLLERVLDAHPMIVGTGEDSVFNGRLDYIRNTIVETSLSGSGEALHSAVQHLADEVVDGMRERWKVIDANTEKDHDDSGSDIEPKRFADKMLTNYYNVGFIHMLFPNALILHVAREPMDTIFSAFKHEFPPGTLDYTSEFSSLTQLYHSYRDIIEHWDKVLPGRVTHVRYEDMVHDMPGMAKAIIDAAGLPWADEVLAFHKKKHAVNTLSTTQVRKGVYKHSLQAWKRYEEPLQPLVKMVGDRVNWDLKTTLSSYVPVTTEEQ